MIYARVKLPVSLLPNTTPRNYFRNLYPVTQVQSSYKQLFYVNLTKLFSLMLFSYSIHNDMHFVQLGYRRNVVLL